MADHSRSGPAHVRVPEVVALAEQRLVMVLRERVREAVLERDNIVL
jgi:hypothetical protein